MKAPFLISHQIFIPEEGQDEGWHERLLMHEYGHVCISLDERPRLLLSHLVSEFTLENIRLDSKEKITKTFINSQINKRIEDYEKNMDNISGNKYSVIKWLWLCRSKPFIFRVYRS